MVRTWENGGRINHRAPFACCAIQTGEHIHREMHKRTPGHAWILFLWGFFVSCLLVSQSASPSHLQSHTQICSLPRHIPYMMGAKTSWTHTHRHTHTACKHVLCGFCQCKPQWKWGCANVFSLLCLFMCVCLSESCVKYEVFCHTHTHTHTHTHKREWRWPCQQ